MNMFVEHLNLKSFILICRDEKKTNEVYLLDSNRNQKFFSFFLNYFFKIKTHKLNYKLLDIVNDEKELITLKLNRETLFELQDKIKNSTYFKSYFNTVKDEYLEMFALRSIIGSGLRDKESLTRAIYLIEVAKSFKTKFQFKNIKIILNDRPWFFILDDYVSETEIILINNFSKYRNIKKFIKNLFINNFRIHNMFFNLKLIKLNALHFKRDKRKLNKKLFFFRRGDVNFNKDGLNSDFFWLINSNFKKKNVLYGDFIKPISKDENKIINSHKIFTIRGPLLLENEPKPFQSYNRLKNHKNINSIKKSLKSYTKYYIEWFSVFRNYNVKLILNWQRFSEEHIAMNSAIRDLGGISALWQLSFIGMPTWSCQAKSDIFFSYSKFSVDIEKKNKSEVKNYIIAGLPRDYGNKYLDNDAKKLRNILHSNGVKKIVSVFDGNSTSTDLRWHSGNEIQKENYEYIILEMFKNKQLGIIFKPKAPQTLKKRLGRVYDLLLKAKETGRCIILENKTEYHSPIPPILAGLASDICVHCDLSSGSSALECAAAKKNVLLLDREGAPYSILNSLDHGKTIFKNWGDIINAINDYDINDKKSEIGNWSILIDKLDPFQDGLSAKRIGNYLEWILFGLNSGYKVDEVLNYASEKYAQIWGHDKIIS